MISKISTGLLIFFPVFFVFACENSIANKKALSNGYYAAEMENFDFEGWKEFISIYVNNGRIVTVEFNAKNSSGLIKSWDPDYIRSMNAVKGTYPSEYIRIYAAALLNLQDPDRIDAVSGASRSHQNFVRLAKAAVEQAKNSAKQVALIKPYPESKKSLNNEK